MAHFIKLEGLENDVYLNVDTIVTMYYDKEAGETLIFSADSPNDHINMKGDVVNSILNFNNDLTMNERHMANYITDKFKSVLASILARLDSISKNLDIIRRVQK